MDVSRYLVKDAYEKGAPLCKTVKDGTGGEGAAVLLALNQPCYLVCYFAVFVTYSVHDVAATVSYDRKELLDIRTAITHHGLDK